MNYLNVDCIRTEIKKERKILEDTRRGCGLTEYGCGRLDAFRFIDSIIDSLQQEQSKIEEDWVEKRKQECGCRRLSANGNYQCERYEGVFGPCDGRCSWIVDYPKLKELEEREQPEVDLEKEIERFLESEESTSHTNAGGYDVAFKDSIKIARHFYELGQKNAANKFDEIEYNRQRAEGEILDKTLDEAAHSYSESDEPLYSPGHRFYWDNESLFGKQIETAFKAGAKWMATQGILRECVVEEGKDIGFSMANPFNKGDSVIIQIRKK